MTGAAHRVARDFRDRACNYILQTEQLQPQNGKAAAAAVIQQVDIRKRLVVAQGSWRQPIGHTPLILHHAVR